MNNINPLQLNKIVMIGNSEESLLNFRLPLIRALRQRVKTLIVCAPHFSPATQALLTDIGVRCETMPMSRTGVNPCKDIKTLFAIKRLLKNERPDCVINYTIKPVIYGTLAAHLAKIDNVIAMITGLGYVFASSGLKVKLLRLLVKSLYRNALKYSKAVFFQNHDDAKLFIDENLLPASKAQVTPGSGVDLNYFQPAAYPKQLSFILVARLLKDKGIYEYIAAAKSLKTLYPTITFYLAGGESDNPNAISITEIKRAHTEGVIYYLGQIKDVRPAIANASVFVLPSYYREGVPKSILEAMAMARPIITTDNIGCRETVSVNENGILIPIQNYMALAQAMEKFIHDPELIKKMGQASRKFAEQRFDVNLVNQQILQAIGFDS